MFTISHLTPSDLLFFFADRVSGSSVDWAYDHAGVKKAFAIELQPSWRAFDENMAFAMPVRKILPSVKETWVGIKAAVNY